ncbi:hypothetical protein [Ammoniphilus sp. YIM 78166]|uniref:hypothetical protein n=1 Tax=Ammoniphilus sp. YIM 78166 TaxID=1644106 RepID=UPI00106F9F8D|nr:hypothetical protein [Ammoniphilus sp. YIM 78166]
MIQINKDGRANLASLTQKHLRYYKDTFFPELEDLSKNEPDLPVRALYRYLRANIDKVVIGEPSVLNDIILYVEQYYGREVKLAKETLKKKLFKYENFRDRKPSKNDPEKWGAYQLVKELKVQVCPYCNRMYTSTILTESGKTRPALDHFFDRATYPYLGVSLYNLVPSCNTCNSSLKGKTMFKLDTHLHPYMEGFGDKIKFTIKLYSGNQKNAMDFILGKPEKYNIKFKVSEEARQNKAFLKRAFNNVKVFKLTELYQTHKDYVSDIIKKSIIYNEDRINELYDLYQGTLFSSKEEIKQMIATNYLEENDLDKRALSKLTKDISEELGLGTPSFL